MPLPSLNQAIKTRCQPHTMGPRVFSSNYWLSTTLWNTVCCCNVHDW